MYTDEQLAIIKTNDVIKQCIIIKISFLLRRNSRMLITNNREIYVENNAPFNPKYGINIKFNPIFAIAPNISPIESFNVLYSY